MTKSRGQFLNIRIRNKKNCIDKIREATNQNQILEARLVKLQKQAANIDSESERKILISQAAAVKEEIDQNPVPASPIFIVDDITTEKLGALMAENNETMALLSAEGGIFKLVNGLYNDRDGNFDLYLKAHAGDPYSCHRIGRESITMNNPRLTMGLAVQPDVLDEIGKNQHFRGRGCFDGSYFLFVKVKRDLDSGNLKRCNCL